MYGYDNAPMPVGGVQGTFCPGAYPYAGVAGVGCYNNSFALIVVLFILLIIIGACCHHWR